MLKRLRFISLVVAMLLFSLKAAHADFSAFGPINPQNGFPLWYQDSNGLALEIGLDPIYNAATFDPVDPNNPFSVQIGFGSEAFYWLAQSTVDMRGGNRGALTLGLEAAFAGLSAVDGEQFVFTRIRIVVDAPVDGTYIVTHPYGVDVFENVQAGPRAIRSVIDVGSFSPDFTGALTSRVGPFLTPADPNIVQPPGFIADVNVLQTVTGSPFGTNYFRIDGPLGSNLDGAGNDFVVTDQFSLSGKIYTGAVPAPLIVQRATYQRTASGNIDVFATSAPTATLSFSGTGFPPITPMSGDGTGRFFGRLNLADASSLPPFVTVTADNPPNTTVTNNRELVDVVTITKAEYDATAQTLTVKANSSDVFAPPALTATGLGSLVNGSLVLNTVPAPPAVVTVTSSAGGSDTKEVNVVNPPSEIITVTRAFFKTLGDRWLVSGTDSVTTTGNSITIHLGGLNGPVIGTAQSSATGVWSVISQNSTIIPNQGDTITLESSGGATLFGVPVTIIRR